MTDHTITDTRDEQIDTEITHEPQVSADVTEGGILGAIGGGIVGALAGGPIGAVIGALIGGGASAAAVDVVEKHDEELTIAGSELPDAVYREAPETIALDEVYVAQAPVLVEQVIIAEIPVVVIEIEDEIRLRAYQLWEERGHQLGLAERDWFDAEQWFWRETGEVSE